MLADYSQFAMLGVPSESVNVGSGATRVEDAHGTPTQSHISPSMGRAWHLESHFFFFFTLVTGPGRSLSPQLSDARVYEPQIRASLGTTAHFLLLISIGPAMQWATKKKYCQV